MRRYEDGKWISEGGCEVGIQDSKYTKTTILHHHVTFYSVCLMKGQEMMSEIMNELQLRAENEKKRLHAAKEWTVSRNL